MPAMTVRDIPEDVHRALKARASNRGRSTEAEVREILAAAVKPEGRLRIGQALHELSQEIGLNDDDVKTIDAARDRTPHEPMSLAE
ncbi:MAG: plasmid stabilization protein [Pseudomonadota bacterium]